VEKARGLFVEGLFDFSGAPATDGGVDEDEVVGALHAHKVEVDEELVGGMRREDDEAIAFGDTESGAHGVVNGVGDEALGGGGHEVVNGDANQGHECPRRLDVEGGVYVADQVADVAAAVEEGDHGLFGRILLGGVVGVDGGVPLGPEGF